MKRLMINCKKATFLISKKEEGKLSFFDGTHLMMHLALCKFCKAFEKQTRFITSNSKNLISSAELTVIDKNNISDALKKNN